MQIFLKDSLRNNIIHTIYLEHISKISVILSKFRFLESLKDCKRHSNAIILKYASKISLISVSFGVLDSLNIITEAINLKDASSISLILCKYWFLIHLKVYNSWYGRRRKDFESFNVLKYELQCRTNLFLIHIY